MVSVIGGWNTTEKCLTCGAVGDVIDDPLHSGECEDCGEECCKKCGLVEGDIDGNMNWCAAHKDGDDD